MELLGVEFTNYACFKSQFIPFKKGPTLLVGRNNAGKTAVLRGLAALEKFPEVDDSFSGYCNDELAGIGIHIWVWCSSADRLIQTTDNVLFEGKAVYSFRCWPSSNLVMFEKAEVVPDDHFSRVAFLVSDETGILQPQYGHGFPNELVVQSKAILATSNVVADVGGSRRHFVERFPKRIEAVLALLRPVSFSQAHRIAENSVPLQTTSELSPDSANLATYLLTLQSNERRRFVAIERVIVNVFEEFESVECRMTDRTVEIALRVRDGGPLVPLSRCGTGVEQMLALLAKIDFGTLVLLDEPHSFLHPRVERHLMDFALAQADKTILISTHSAVAMNSVQSSQILYLEAPGTSFDKPPLSQQNTLEGLGYRNSDLLFEDRIIFGEGPTEPDVLPILLTNAGVPELEVRRTGFLRLNGVPEKAGDQQKAIGKYEEILDCLNRSRAPRLYLFDGDRAPKDRERLKQTKNARTGQNVNIEFLNMTELENYLLVPEAIALAIRDEASDCGIDVTPHAEEVQAELATILAEREDAKLFPRGGGDNPFQSCKGSVALERVFARFGELTYDKRRTGKRVASYVNLQNQQALIDLKNIFDALAKPTDLTNAAAIAAS